MKEQRNPRQRDPWAWHWPHLIHFHLYQASNAPCYHISRCRATGQQSISWFTIDGAIVTSVKHCGSLS